MCKASELNAGLQLGKSSNKIRMFVAMIDYRKVNMLDCQWFEDLCFQIYLIDV